MVNSVVIAENAECAAGCAYDEQRQVALFPLKTNLFAAQHHGGHCHRDQIAEKCFLRERQITRQTHECRHHRKTECGHDDKTDCLTFFRKH